MSVELLASGGLTGGALALVSHLTNGLTSWLAARTEMKKRAMEMQHEATMFPLRAEAAKTENEWKAFNASHLSAAGTVNDATPGWASAVLTCTRPALTLGLCLASFVLHVAGMPAPVIDELAGFAVGWWFGNRQLGKARA